MPVKSRSRFARLKKAVRKIENPARRTNEAHAILAARARHISQSIKIRFPRGQDEPDLVIRRRRPGSSSNEFTIKRGRPSERLHGITLAKGWRNPEVKSILSGKQAGASLRVINVAPHLQFVLRGTPPHPIPGPVAFHWGDPLRWPPKDGFAPGPRLFGRIKRHPGAEPVARPAVEEASAIYLPLIRRDLHQFGARRLLYDPLIEVLGG